VVYLIGIAEGSELEDETSRKEMRGLMEESRKEKTGGGKDEDREVSRRKRVGTRFGNFGLSLGTLFQGGSLDFTDVTSPNTLIPSMEASRHRLSRHILFLSRTLLCPV
jgi:hypothetical protein